MSEITKPPKPPRQRIKILNRTLAANNQVKYLTQYAYDVVKKQKGIEFVAIVWVDENDNEVEAPQNVAPAKTGRKPKNPDVQLTDSVEPNHED